MSVQSNEIPTDQEIWEALDSKDGGLKPSELVEILESKGHDFSDIVKAVQRVFDRGTVRLVGGGRLVTDRAMAEAA
ncbi:MAG: hypothetical protein ABL918_10820 [Chakrabartia sp.]